MSPLEPLGGNTVDSRFRRLFLAATLSWLFLAAPAARGQNTHYLNSDWSVDPLAEGNTVPAAPSALGLPGMEAAAKPPVSGLDAFGPGCVYCGQGEDPPLWSTVQAVRILARTRAADITLGSQSVFGGQQVVMNGKSFSFDIAPGYDTTLERHLGRDARNMDWFAQAGFWGLNSWVSEGRVESDTAVVQDTALGWIVHGPLNSPWNGAFVGLDWANALAGHYNSHFNSAEVNLVVRPRGRPDRLVLHPSGRWQRECQPGQYWSFLLGVRYFDVRERFELNGRSIMAIDANRDGDVTDPGDTPLAIATGTYLLRTDNDMIGPQIGTEMMFRQCTWEWGLRFKVAPMADLAEQDLAVTTVDPVFGDKAAAFRDRRTELAGLIEFGVVGSYKLRPNLAVHAAYDLAWLTGVALAPDQATSPGRVNLDGGLFFHGLVAGFEWTR